jgi:hypothetical protein
MYTNIYIYIFYIYIYTIFFSLVEGGLPKPNGLWGLPPAGPSYMQLSYLKSPPTNNFSFPLANIIIIVNLLLAGNPTNFVINCQLI